MLECHFQSETKIEPDLRLQRIQLSHNKFINGILGVRLTWLDVKANCSAKGKACFKRLATAVANAIDRIKFDFSTAVARRLKPSRATALWYGTRCRATRQQLDLVSNVMQVHRAELKTYSKLRMFGGKTCHVCPQLPARVLFTKRN